MRPAVWTLLVAALSTAAGAILLNCGRDAGPESIVVTGRCHSELPPRARGETPDLLLITIDTLRADRLGAYGYPDASTPVLDDLASRGTRFEGATTSFPRTTPALASLMTGLWPTHHGSREVGSPMRSGATLASVLCAEGYETRAITASTVAGPTQGFAEGFLAFETVPLANAETITEHALAQLDSADPARPTFLWIHYLDPHLPYLPPEHWPQPEAAACRELMDQVRTGALELDRVFGNLDGVSERALDSCRALYDSEIAYTDASIGRLFAGLEQRERLEGALVIVTSDHGENLGERGLFFEHGPNVHDASLRIPLIVSGPAVRPGHRDTGVAQLEDVVPTVLGLLGVPADRWPAVDGADLGARLDGAKPPDRTLLSESGSALHHRMADYPVSGRAGEAHCVNDARYSLCFVPGKDLRLYDRIDDPARTRDRSHDLPDVIARLSAAADRWPVEGARERSARTARFKLVEIPILSGGYQQTLYDLSRDPEERTDILADHPQEASRLGKELSGWGEPTDAAERDAGLLESLRSLGYVE